MAAIEVMHVGPCCQQCGAPLHVGRIFCSQACQHRSMRRSRPTLTCEGCGSDFAERRRTHKDAQRFCSRPCADAHRPVSPLRPETVAAIVWAAMQRAHGSLRVATPKPEPPSAVCRHCAGNFRPAHGNQRAFCSKRCRLRHLRRKIGKHYRHRARHHGVAYEAVDRLKVFERDGWRCQVCGAKTPKRLMGTTRDRAPELDHRRPMALGGGHTWANCQCACRRCNQAKGGVIVVGQIPLFEKPIKSTR